MTEPLTPNSLLTLYRSGQVDATILMQIRLDDWRPALLRENGFPFVMIGRCENNEHYDFIDLDFEGTILTSFEHLVGLGHRHIGFITRPTWMRTEKFGVAVRLYRGYERAVEQFGLVPLVREVNLTAEDVARATEEMLAEQPNLSALVISNGAASVGAVRTLIAHGRQVPRDASVIALATDKIAGLITPQLTSIRFPTDSMGELAARLLIRKMEQAEHRTEHHLLAPALVERESTAQAHR
jgi:DNA-binding LacI/PurR family transcriptional regulator